MNEQPDRIERELKAMLSVDPSPDLQARIRARAFAAPPKRTPWFAWASGLAAAATVAVVLMVINSGPKASEVKPTAPVITQQEEIPRQPPVAIAVAINEERAPIRQSRRSRKQTEVKTVPAAVLVPLQVTTAAPAGDIRLQALKPLEVASFIEPIPQAPFPIAGFQEINIEPPQLTVPTLGVQQ